MYLGVPPHRLLGREERVWPVDKDWDKAERVVSLDLRGMRRVMTEDEWQLEVVKSHGDGTSERRERCAVLRGDETRKVAAT